MDKMREEFESWAMSDMGYMCVRVGGGYKDDYMNTAWLAWKASRALLCVELPPKYNYRYPEPFNDGFDCAVEEIEETLCKCGVPYK